MKWADVNEGAEPLPEEHEPDDNRLPRRGTLDETCAGEVSVNERRCVKDTARQESGNYRSSCANGVRKKETKRGVPAD